MGELLTNLFWADLGGVRVSTIGMVVCPAFYASCAAAGRLRWKRRLKRMWHLPPDGRREGVRPPVSGWQIARAEQVAAQARERAARREQRQRSQAMVGGLGQQPRRGKGSHGGQFLPKPTAAIPADAQPITPDRP